MIIHTQPKLCRVAALSRLMTAVSQPVKPCAASYICELTRVPGKFLPAKAQELGVPKGHLYGVLKGGQPVTLKDGTTIQPHQVIKAAGCKSARRLQSILPDCSIFYLGHHLCPAVGSGSPEYLSMLCGAAQQKVNVYCSCTLQTFILATLV